MKVSKSSWHYKLVNHFFRGCIDESTNLASYLLYLEIIFSVYYVLLSLSFAMFYMLGTMIAAANIGIFRDIIIDVSLDLFVELFSDYFFAVFVVIVGSVLSALFSKMKPLDFVD